MTNNDITGVSSLVVATMIGCRRVILSDAALATIAEALEDYAARMDTPDDSAQVFLLAEIIRNTEDGALDMPSVAENGEPNPYTRALLDDLRAAGAVIVWTPATWCITATRPARTSGTWWSAGASGRACSMGTPGGACPWRT